MPRTELEVLLTKFSQNHVLEFFNRITDSERSSLKNQLQSIDIGRVCDLFQQYAHVVPEEIASVKPIPIENYAVVQDMEKAEVEKFSKIGLDAIGHGKVAVIVLAGGQATRLGADAPKGTLSLGLKRENDTLLGLQATQIVKLQDLAAKGSLVHWFVMTSQATLSATREHLFGKVLPASGLQRSQVHLFSQAEMPCFTNDGKFILANKNRIATAPDGNGGLYAALKNSCVKKMYELGIKYVHVYCVDNILCRVADPEFIGFCIEKQADCAAKVVEKCDPTESVGIVCKVNGVTKVIEYSEISKELAEAKDAKNPGKLALRAGNIANHFFTVEFLDRVSSLQLPFHLAHKKIPHIDCDGNAVKPQQPNGIKMEQFVFDVFQYARNFYVWEVSRQKEFSPLKNAESVGKDCMSTCRRDLWNLHRKWIENAGGRIESDGTSDQFIEIDGRLSYAGEGLEPFASDKTFRLPLFLK